MKNTFVSDKVWHHLSTDETIHLLVCDPQQGLNSEEAKGRFTEYGANVLTAKQGQSAWVRFVLQFHQPLIYILIGAGCITAVLQEWVDSGVIFGVVLVNGIIGYIQESKAENALAALAHTMVSEATAFRSAG